MSLHNDVGAFGEALTRETLAQIAPVQDGQAADLRFCGMEIEVKTARPSLYNGQTRGYQFLLKKRDQYGVTNFRKADVLVLICLNEALDPVATYVLPTALLRDRKKITIPASLSTRYDVFRNRWDVIAEAYNKKGVKHVN